MYENLKRFLVWIFDITMPDVLELTRAIDTILCVDLDDIAYGLAYLYF